jgi:hypothetical protein
LPVLEKQWPQCPFLERRREKKEGYAWGKTYGTGRRNERQHLEIKEEKKYEE